MRFKTLSRVSAAFALAALLGWPVIAAAESAAPRVEDNAGMFKPDTVRQAEAILSDIRDNTAGHKAVTVVTEKDLPEGRDARQAAESLFQERKLNGVLIVVYQRPGKLQVVVGEKTQSGFSPAKRNEVARILTDSFRKREFDAGLLEALRYTQKELRSGFPAGGAGSRSDGAVPIRHGADRGTNPYAGAEGSDSDGYGATGWGSWSTWLCLGAGVLGVILVVRMIGGLFGSRGGGYGPGGYGPGGGYGMGGGYGGGGGGGFMSGMLGGLFGATAGNWLYNSFGGGGSSAGHGAGAGTAYGSTGSGFGGSDAGVGSDEGQVGSATGGDFGGGGDAGGDFGGGFSGGDAGGGGDFGGGGGGDFGGGGGDNSSGGSF
jgi:uncharacterized protein